MTSGLSGADGILSLARELRQAAVARQETMQEVLRAYNHDGGARLDYAAAFLKATQQADAAYEQCTRDALRIYRAGVRSEAESSPPESAP